jgi:hypothetical protein
VHKATMALEIIKQLQPTLGDYQCAPVDLINDFIAAREWTLYITHADIARAMRVYTGIEWTACDDSFTPCVHSRQPCCVYLHPERVHKDAKEPYVNWLYKLANGWLRKADSFKEQM